jgi:hypothetical protein
MQANPDIEDFSDGKGNHAYRELLAQLLAETRRFAGEVLLVHGDSHVHRIDSPCAIRPAAPWATSPASKPSARPSWAG